MSITREKLSKSGAKSSDIEAIVRDQIRIIDEALMQHLRTWGRNTVEFLLPNDPGVRGLGVRDAQKLIYTQIMQSLEKRGFDVEIEISDKANYLYISWVTDLDPEEVKAMEKYIREHMRGQSYAAVASAPRPRPSAPGNRTRGSDSRPRLRR